MIDVHGSALLHREQTSPLDSAIPHQAQS
jgi:hypothetical protein